MMTNSATHRLAQIASTAALLGLIGCVEMSEPLDDVAYPTTVDPVDHFNQDAARVVPDATNADRDEGDTVSPTASGLPIVVFQDFSPWQGRIVASLQADLELIEGEDYEVLPTASIAAGIPAETTTVIVSSNSEDRMDTAQAVLDPFSQYALGLFVENGGTLLMHLADNQPEGLRFLAPGMLAPRNDSGNSNVLEVVDSANDFVAGADGVIGTEDDANTENVQLLAGSWAHHGDLDESLPANANALVTGQDGRIIYAEYPHGQGRVVVATITFEYGAEFLPGLGFGHTNRMVSNHVWFSLFGSSGPADSDNDGVIDDEDLCLGTVMPEDVPILGLRPVRYALTDASGVFSSLPPAHCHEMPPEFTIQDTAGCSCRQIIENLDPGTRDHEKYGCSISLMRTWVDIVNQ